MLIDTHCHINHEDLRLDARAVITHARDVDVRKMLIVGCDYEDSCEAAGMAEDFSQFGLYAAIGIHPHEAKRYTAIPEVFRDIARSNRVVAIGETGLDYHYDHSPRDVQKKMFQLHLKFAEELAYSGRYGRCYGDIDGSQGLEAAVPLLQRRIAVSQRGNRYGRNVRLRWCCYLGH